MVGIRTPRTDLQIRQNEHPGSALMITTLKKACINTGIAKSDLNFLMEKRGLEPDKAVAPSDFSAMVGKVAHKFGYQLSVEQIQAAAKDSAYYCNNLLYEANGYQKMNKNSHIHSIIGAILGAGFMAAVSPPKSLSESIRVVGGAIIGYVLGSVGRITEGYNKSKKENMVRVAYAIKAAAADASNNQRM